MGSWGVYFDALVKIKDLEWIWQSFFIFFHSHLGAFLLDSSNSIFSSYLKWSEDVGDFA